MALGWIALFCLASIFVIYEWIRRYVQNAEQLGFSYSYYYFSNLHPIPSPTLEFISENKDEFNDLRKSCIWLSPPTQNQIVNQCKWIFAKGTSCLEMLPEM